MKYRATLSRNHGSANSSSSLNPRVIVNTFTTEKRVNKPRHTRGHNEIIDGVITDSLGGTCVCVP